MPCAGSLSSLVLGSHPVALQPPWCSAATLVLCRCVPCSHPGCSHDLVGHRVQECAKGGGDLHLFEGHTEQCRSGDYNESLLRCLHQAPTHASHAVRLQTRITGPPLPGGRRPPRLTRRARKPSSQSVTDARMKTDAVAMDAQSCTVCHSSTNTGTCTAAGALGCKRAWHAPGVTTGGTNHVVK